ncbi:Synaptic vesicle 2-related protein [Durusdinium trenchii]|uniref:Synaptic vesicle 2-related protein n=1 Tax=Durusdinium trenchii TaxID=1381693 RepID=A0ABP0HN50_9DINO
MYNAGWSHGKEKLGDKPDFAKGSFYFNPLSDTPGTEDDMAKFPWALPKNRWPKEIPELERKCKDLGKVMQEVIGFLGEQVDHVMASKVPTNHQKAGHNDSGFMTGLTPDLFAALQHGSEIENPDPEGAGLWIVDRDGAAVRVKIPKDCMAIQVGECTQVVTGGEFVATPHCVRGCRPQYCAGRKVARVSCPCFVDTHPTFELRIPDGFSSEAMLAKGVSSKVPPLAERWEFASQRDMAMGLKPVNLFSKTDLLRSHMFSTWLSRWLMTARG